MDLALTFTGDMVASTEPDRIDVLPGGKVRLTGSVAGRVKDAHARKKGALIRSGAVQFAISGRRHRPSAATQAGSPPR